jgi:hypothetical protein
MPLTDGKESVNVEEVEKRRASSKSPPAPGIRLPADDEERLTVTEVRKSGTSSETSVDTENTVGGDRLQE